MIKKTKIAVLTSVLLLFIIAGYLWQAGFLSRKADPSSGPLEKITISALPIYTPGLLFVAQEKGYFRNNGLEVTINLFQTGQIGMEHLQAGQVDISYSAEFVLVERIFQGGKSLRCLGSIAAAEINYLLALKERGISQPGDLKGKRIGVARGTIAEFFLGRFLTFNHLSLKDVTIIFLNPAEMAAALADNRLDAVMVWDPVTYEIKDRLGDRVISWPGQAGQKFYNVLVSTDEFIRNRSKALQGLFRALTQAEKFIKSNRDESLAIIAKQIDIDQAIFKTDWSKSGYVLSFNQSLLILMEDQARWMMRNKLTSQTTLPNYLDYLHAEALAKVDPQTVRFIVPKSVMKDVPASPERETVNR